MADVKNTAAMPLTHPIRRPRSHIRNHGFTLVEVMVVTVVVAVLAGAAVMSLGGATGTAALRSSAAQLLRAAQYAQGYATTRGVTCRLVVDAREGRFYLERESSAAEKRGQFEVMTEDGVRPVALPQGVTFGAVRVGTGKEATDEEGRSVVTFRPTGEADAALVELTDGTRSWTLRVAATTGRCEVVEGRADEVLSDRVDLDE